MQILSNAPAIPPDCPLCPRLAAFRHDNRQKFQGYFNGPVPSFGTLDATLAVVGLAPGLHGANQTGRPFTGDYAGIILYSALKKAGLAVGEYTPEKLMKCVGDQTADGFSLVNTRITNGVRCVPPENKPETVEIKTCNTFLKAELAAMPKLKVILSLGGISHQAVLMANGLKKSAFKFGHAAEHVLPSGVTLLDSYHTSRYNINTGSLTQAMFDAVVMRAKELMG